MKKYFDYRGVDNAVYAEIITDTTDKFEVGEVKDLTGVAEIGKETEMSTSTKYYDNQPAIVIDSYGADTISIDASGVPHNVQADLTGQYYDETTGLFVEGEPAARYFAFGYKTEKTDGTVVYVWRLKGKFQFGQVTHHTKDNSTDSNGQALTYTGINTTHKFAATGKTAKAVNIDTDNNPLMDDETWFATVQTPDTISGVEPGIGIAPSSATVKVGGKKRLNASVTPAGQEITWTSSADAKATVTDGVVTGVAAGTATITATITVGGQTYTDTCAVTVTAD